MFDLTGKAAIVTGSTRGIGLAIAQALIAQGARVVISSESEADTARVAAQLGMPGCACDVTDDDAQAALVDFALASLGRLDILVCNAGITGQAGRFADIDMDDYARVMAINLRSQVVLCNLALPHLAAAGVGGGAGGAAVLVASLAGLRGNGRINAYALAKAGVAQLARNLAVEWGAAGCARQRRVAGLHRHRPVAPAARRSGVHGPPHGDDPAAPARHARRGRRGSRLLGKPGRGLRDRPQPGGRWRHARHRRQLTDLDCNTFVRDQNGSLRRCSASCSIAAWILGSPFASWSRPTATLVSITSRQRS